MIRKLLIGLTGIFLPLIGCASGTETMDSSSPQEEKAVLSVTLDCVNTWNQDERLYSQYDLAVENISDEDVSGWEIVLDGSEDFAFSDGWNIEVETDEAGNAVVKPKDYNRVLPKGKSDHSIGFIVSSIVYDPVRVHSGTPAVTVAKNEEEREVPNGTIETKPKGLHIDHSHICDTDGREVQLRGISLHGLAWFGQYVTEDTFRTLRDEWNVNTIRLPLYTEEYGGYCSGGDQTTLKDLIHEAAGYTKKLGMYLIIDWHTLSDQNPNTHLSEAKQFFDEMSSYYCNDTHILYEICNEPQNSPWHSVIRPYAEEVVSVIRRNDPDALIIVGTNTWAQDIDEVIGDMLDDPNVLYSLHFYAATHKDDIRGKLKKAYDAGIPVIVSECGLSEASGNGSIDTESSEAWFDYLFENGIGFTVWSLSNKDESSALISSACNKTDSWSDEELSEAGRWLKNMLMQRK